ncbi:MAG: response regulator [Lachnospiraceae bacterium]|nr:response regulator [Lachnospiraceae bacterium]
MLHEIVILIHFIGLLFCFATIYSMGKSESKQDSNYMVVTIVCNIISLVGYICELMANDLSGMIVAAKMQYLGKGFVGTFMLFTFVRYYKWDFPKTLMKIFWFIDMAMFVVILGIDHHNLYYTSMNVIEVDGNFFFKVDKSPLYVLFMIYMMGTVITFACLCYKHWKKSVGRQRKILRKLAVASVLTVLGVSSSIFGISRPYDMVPLIITIYTVVIAILIKKYGLFSAVMIAKENLITSIEEGVIVRDVEGKVTYANPKASELIPALVTAEAEIVRDTIDTILNNRETDTVMFGGSYYQIKVRTLIDEKEEVGQMITFFDVTEIQENSKKMEKLKLAADNANKAKSSFLANMSHEIRTPINAVLGMDEMILREAENEDIREYAVNIKRAGETLLSLVSDILDFSKIESGKMTLINESYNTAELIRDLSTVFSIRMNEKGLSFIVEADKDIPSVLKGDEVRLKQIVMNLLSNACKYTREGSVTLKVTGEKADNTYRLNISVEDTGIGIKEENIARLFETFERIDEKKNRHIEGTGLGLNITRNLLVLMGSDIQVESTYGKGTRFFFTVEQQIIDSEPIGELSDSEQRKEKYIKLDTTFVAPEAKVLVVDDNAVNLAVVKGLLKRTKVQVDMADSGKKCLRHVRDNKYDVIFMDHLMPEMDGIETLKAMKAMEDNLNKDTPVIVLTANAVAGSREMYMAAGFNDYITKPVDGRKIEEVLYNLIPDELIEVQ